MPDTACPYCHTVGFVRKERIITGSNSVVEFTCGRCNRVWASDDRCDVPDRRATSRGDRRKHR